MCTPEFVSAMQGAMVQGGYLPSVQQTPQSYGAPPGGLIQPTANPTFDPNFQPAPVNVPMLGQPDPNAPLQVSWAPVNPAAFTIAPSTQGVPGGGAGWSGTMTRDQLNQQLSQSPNNVIFPGYTPPPAAATGAAPDGSDLGPLSDAQQNARRANAQDALSDYYSGSTWSGGNA